MTAVYTINPIVININKQRKVDGGGGRGDGGGGEDDTKMAGKWEILDECVCVK